MNRTNRANRKNPINWINWTGKKRWAVFLALATCKILSSGAANATTLSGRLEQMSTRTTSGANLNLAWTRSYALPESYEGNWQCETTVTDSRVDSVVVGDRIVSEVDFVKDQTGAINSAWKQDGWAEGHSRVSTISPSRAQMDRTSYYMLGTNAGLWAARAHGEYTKITNDRIIACSVVDQYMDGQYVGRYYTTSVLKRLKGQGDMAIIKVREPNDNDGPAYLIVSGR